MIDPGPSPRELREAVSAAELRWVAALLAIASESRNGGGPSSHRLEGLRLDEAMAFDQMREAQHRQIMGGAIVPLTFPRNNGS